MAFEPVKPNYQEYANKRMPDVVEICRRCKERPVMALPGTNPRMFACHRCSEPSRGEPFIRVSKLRVLLEQHMAGDGVALLMQNIAKVIEEQLPEMPVRL